MNDSSSPTVNKTKTGFVVPSGYSHIGWKLACEGSTVYLVGCDSSEPKAYGPFTVVSVSGKTLRNKVGREFMHGAEDLLLRREDESN